MDADGGSSSIHSHPEEHDEDLEDSDEHDLQEDDEKCFQMFKGNSENLMCRQMDHHPELSHKDCPNL